MYVVEYCAKFLRRMVFLNPNNAPTEEAKAALPSDFTLTSLIRQWFYSMMKQHFKPMKISQPSGLRGERL